MKLKTLAFIGIGGFVAKKVFFDKKEKTTAETIRKITRSGGRKG